MAVTRQRLPQASVIVGTAGIESSTALPVGPNAHDARAG
ncbi:hypothetical protein OCAE111667_23865 [Occultella aeris]|uniref:Uncharacterized protein n=1 Tax=Occultella aeris TaxID=2761496 RepID=A0A7M4DLK5_9MICO|nr:hypothetical protein HALOF300_03022 [Occultella aeris]